MKDYIDIYAPVHVPINWQTELTVDNEHRYRVLTAICNVISGLNIRRVPWEFGYGSTKHDNIPVAYQPAAILSPNISNREKHVLLFDLYIYDHTVSILHARISYKEKLSSSNDLWITNEVERLCRENLSSIFKEIQNQPILKPLIDTRKYNFFDIPSDKLTSGMPIWVARMLTTISNKNEKEVRDWIDWPTDSDQPLLIGHGNYLLKDEDQFDCANRAILMAQYFSTILFLAEDSIINQMRKITVKRHNGRSIETYLKRQQYRQDHLTLLGALYASAISGMQGKRRVFLEIINKEWSIEKSLSRIRALMDLNQSRLDRIKFNIEKRNRRSLQILLTFLTSVSVLSLLIDIRAFMKIEDHSESIGLFDLLSLASAETSITLAMVAVIILSYVIGRTGEL